jgi:hypothetical protein
VGWSARGHLVSPFSWHFRPPAGCRVAWSRIPAVSRGSGSQDACYSPLSYFRFVRGNSRFPIQSVCSFVRSCSSVFYFLRRLTRRCRGHYITSYSCGRNTSQRVCVMGWRWWCFIPRTRSCKQSGFYTAQTACAPLATWGGLRAIPPPSLFVSLRSSRSYL